MAEIDTLDTGRFITQLSSFRRKIGGCVTPLGRIDPPSMDDESVESRDRGLMEGRGVRLKERRKEGRKEGVTAKK